MFQRPFSQANSATDYVIFFDVDASSFIFFPTTPNKVFFSKCDVAFVDGPQSNRPAPATHLRMRERYPSSSVALFV